ncbi:MAG: WbqC family protein [Nanoarchaeota archaeon]|nr:WbqC family protein [Nanoarchaeota archaeon]MBU1030459.1 WbqC family protein [Nanoarchaeota archaeon]MBU1850067.1 WbqC family protein [Nanoarchaeota archaeon]
MIVSIHQPTYLPYIGFFDKMKKSDVFVLYDTAQFVKNEFHNRNQIVTRNEPLWLTVPVSKDSYLQPLFKVKISNQSFWQRKHLKSIEQSYSKKPFFSKFFPKLNSIYEDKYDFLLDINIRLIEEIKDFFGIKTKIVRANYLDYDRSLKSTDAIISICKTLGADTYLSGDGARAYIETDKFKDLNLEFQNFKHPIYNQHLKGKNEFVPNLSAVDYLFNEGSKDW